MKKSIAPTKYQLIVLTYPPVEGVMEASIQAGLNRGAIDLIARSCRKRGWLDSEGCLTASGEAALQNSFGSSNQFSC